LLIEEMKKKLREIRARDILVVMGWAATITLITMITEYVKTPRHGFTETYFGVLDMAIILAASLAFGIFLVDPVKILYRIIGTISLSLVMSVICSSLYDLYVLGLGRYFSDVVPGWEWEWVTWLAFFRIFKLMFPVATILIFAGGMVGGIVSELMWPHRG